MTPKGPFLKTSSTEEGEIRAKVRYSSEARIVRSSRFRHWAMRRVDGIILGMKVYVSTIVRSNDKILLIQEGKQSCYGKWNVPSGHLEEDEDILAGAAREVREETGLEVKLSRLVGVYNNQFEGNNSIQFTFLAEVEDCKDLEFDRQEILDARWVNVGEVMSYDLRDAEYICDALDKIGNSKTFPLDVIVVR